MAVRLKGSIPLVLTQTIGTNKGYTMLETKITKRFTNTVTGEQWESSYAAIHTDTDQGVTDYLDSLALESVEHATDDGLKAKRVVDLRRVMVVFVQDMNDPGNAENNYTVRYAAERSIILS